MAVVVVAAAAIVVVCVGFFLGPATATDPRVGEPATQAHGARAAEATEAADMPWFGGVRVQGEDLGLEGFGFKFVVLT